jgi:UDP-N-acetylglucosamine acyltransferase
LQSFPFADVLEMTSIHPTAVVSGKAEIDASVSIGPFAVIEDNVHIAAGSTIGPHAVIREFCRIGENNTIDAHVVIGGHPQHTQFDGSETWVEVGDNNVIREATVIHRAFEPGAATRIGSDCFLMSQLHIGHDCVIGDNVTLSSYVVLGGHVEIGDYVVMGGSAGAHQFLRIGAYAMVGGFVPLRKDVLPYSMIGGEPVRHYRLNTIGLRRGGFDKERYRALEAAYRALRDGNKKMTGVPDTDDVNQLRKWLAAKSKCGVYGFTGR